MGNDFIKPRYDRGGFAGLPLRIRDWLTGSEKYNLVVLFLVDGFGWRFVEQFQDTSFLKQVVRRGQLEKLTAQFPSTTAAHLTTLHTGLPVGEHGIFEWIYYEPTLDVVIAPLLFSYSGTAERDTLKAAGVKPRSLYPGTTFYGTLKKRGITSTILQNREYTPSTYSDAMFRGALVRSYRDLPEGLVNLSQMLEKATPPAYFVLYYDKIDGVSHDYGPGSSQTEAEIQAFLLMMEHIFQKTTARHERKILCLLTADHGQVETDPQTTIYLNREPRFAGVEKYLKTNKDGKLLAPAGSARDFFLYIREGMVDEAQTFLSDRLEGHAEVRKVTDLIAEGYFGPIISTKFPARAGELAILPYRGEAIWWYEKDKFEQRFRGHHGGLTPQEMEIPLLIWEL
ncbi:MAG TPA: alkaline phosphatase family protein [Anaerolineales bacterium]